MKLLEVSRISKEFISEKGLLGTRKSRFQALKEVSFSLDRYKTVGIVGESGSGKTTLAKIILKLIPQTSGEVIFDKGIITNFRKDIQIIFQNPYSSLNPKMSVSETLSEPLLIHKIVSGKGLKDKLRELLGLVGLEEDVLRRYPAEFSGGQRQRICIARAIATSPKFIVLDEPISSLDLTLQADMIDLFRRLKKQLDLTYIFISHNLALIKLLSDNVIVMQQGRIVEEAETEKLFLSPRNTYTKMLLSSITQSS